MVNTPQNTNSNPHLETEGKLSARQAEVRLRGERAGLLQRLSSKSFVFKYDRDYLSKKDPVAIAISFPLGVREYQSEELHPFFDNLIIEGWLLHQTEKEFHIDKKNRWGLLMLVGANPVGAVSVHALDSDGMPQNDAVSWEEEGTRLFSVESALRPGICSYCLKTTKGAESIHSACARKLWGTSRALSVRLDRERPLQSFSKTAYSGSISGAQRKGLFAVVKNELRIDSGASQYILKPEGDYPELPANEHLTMTAARHLKFEVPPTGLVHIDQVGFVFVIQRFDRLDRGYKLLTEDMAQIYEEASDNKYSLSLEKVGQAISQYTQAGPLHLNDYFRRVLFCFLTANGDMHLKNWSLLEIKATPGSYRLSPVYDWLNTRIALSRELDELALPMGGKKRNLQKSYIRNFALNELGLTKSYVDKVFAEVPLWAKAIEDLIPRSFLSERMKKSYRDVLAQRSKRLQ